MRRLSARGWKSRLYVEVMAKTSVLCLCISTMTRRPLTRKRLNSQRDGDKTRQSRCKAVRRRVLGGWGGRLLQNDMRVGRPPRFLPLLISLAARLAFSRLPFPSFPSPTEINRGEPLSHRAASCSKAEAWPFATKVWKHAPTENLRTGQNDCNVPFRGPSCAVLCGVLVPYLRIVMYRLHYVPIASVIGGCTQSHKCGGMLDS